MATAVNDSYSAASGETIYGGREGPSTLPAWRQAMSPWEWVELSGTAAFSGEQPDVTTGLGGLDGRLNAWNGLCAVGTKVCSAGAGGHADYAGNEAYSIELNADAPAWGILRQPTPAADLLTDSAYYADGRPSSSHTYYNLHGLLARNRVFRVGNGSQWGGGNSMDRELVAFRLDTNDWDTADTWPDAPTASYALATCQNLATGDIYVSGETHLHRLNADDMTWGQVAPWLDNSSAVYYAASAVDTTRDRVVFFADAYQTAAGGLVCDIAGGTFSKIAFTGTPAADAAVIGPAGNTAWFDPVLDRFILKSRIGDDVYLVHPTTWAITAQITTGGATITNATNGVFNKFVAVPALGGIFYQPNHASNGWFLATE